MTRDVFRSTNLAARRGAGFGSDCCVVTFASYTDIRTLDRPGFGEEFLASVRLDAIHVLSRDNDWYQYPEMFEAIDAVNHATMGYRRVVTYGSSMGGYAALRLAGLLKAKAILALSPQYSINRFIVPWELRWRESSVRFQDVWERALPFPKIDAAYVIYDPAVKEDKRQVALIRRAAPCVPIALRYSGHPVSGFLAEIGLLQRAVIAVCHDGFDGAALVREAKTRRAQSAQYLYTMAENRLFITRARRIALLREALRLGPNNAMICARLGQHLARVGSYEESLSMHQKAIEIAPENRFLARLYSSSLATAGEFTRALQVLEEVIAGAVVSPQDRARLDLLRAKRDRMRR